MKIRKIGFLQETSYHENQIQLFQGALEAARQENFSLIRFAIENKHDHGYYNDQLSFLTGMIKKFSLDGLLFAGWNRDLIKPGFIQKLLFNNRYNPEKDMPIVSVGKIFEDISSTHVPGEHLIRELLEHLAGFHGYKKIVFIQPVFPDDRFGAYMKVMQEYNLFDSSLVIKSSDLGEYNDFDFAGRAAKIVEVLKERNLLDADAVMSMFNEEAALLAVELQNLGYNIPGDIALTGWDDSDIGKYHTPSITSVYYPFYELAYQGCKKLIGLVNHKKCEHITGVSGQLNIRESCGCSLGTLIEKRLNGRTTSINLENSKNGDFSCLPDMVGNRIKYLDKPTVFDQLKAELFEERKDSFFNYIHTILSGNRAVKDLLHLYEKELHFLREALTVLYKSDAEALLKIERLWLKLHILFKEKYASKTGKDELERGRIARIFTQIGLQITSAANLADLYSILRDNLQRTGIKSCYIFLFENQKVCEDYQVLDFCYSAEKKACLTGSGEKIVNSRLAGGFLFDGKPCNYVLNILHFQNRLLGFVLYEPGPGEQGLYHALSIQLSGSIAGALTLSSLEYTNDKLKEQTGQIRELNEQLRDENLRILTEMELAKRIQVGLLPSNIEHNNYDIAAIMIPAAEVGGDYYDVIHINGIDWIIMGDVSGHGVSAGLVMMMVQTSIHVVLNRQPDLPPDQLLTIINRTITHNIHKLKEEKFVTIIVLACYEGNRFYYAGMHLPMMIYRKKEAAVELIYTEGMWLGVMEDIEKMNKNRYFDLEQGDCLLLYTDGIIEARHREDRKNFYGVEKLKQSLTEKGEKKSSLIVEELLKSLSEYTTNDDISLLVVKKR